MWYYTIHVDYVQRERTTIRITSISCEICSVDTIKPDGKLHRSLPWPGNQLGNRPIPINLCACRLYIKKYLTDHYLFVCFIVFALFSQPLPEKPICLCMMFWQQTNKCVHVHSAR